MNIEWFIYQIAHINIPTILLSIGGSWGAKEFVDWVKRRNLQKQQVDMQKDLQLQKADFDRELESTKVRCQQEIQFHYLQTQLKITSLYKIYPELFSSFKIAEGSLYSLYYHTGGNQEKTRKELCSLTQCLAKHSLFLNKSLIDACIKAKDSLIEGINAYASMDQKAKDAFMIIIHEQVDKVRNLMRDHLLEKETNI